MNEIDNDIDDNAIRIGGYELRDYQEHLFNEAKKENIVICLPTGSGKTLIAFSLMHHMFHETIGTTYPSSDIKRMFFLAPNRALISQQYEKAINLLPGKLMLITGDQQPDDFDTNEWNERLKNNQIFFMTPAVLYNMITKGYINFQNINLIIFDEVHWATKKNNRDSGHDYSLIMKLYRNIKCNERKPKILGMSATVVPFKPKKIQEFYESLEKIENIFEARVLTKNFQHHKNLCQEIVIEYSNSNEFGIEIDFDFKKAYKYLSINYYNDTNTNDDSSSNSVKDILKQFRLAFEKIHEYLHETMGPWFAMEVIELFQRSLLTMSLDFGDTLRKLMISIKKSIIKAIDDKYSIKKDDIKLLTDGRLISDRLRILLLIIEEFQKDEKFTGIIFVTERTDANMLYCWLLQLSRLDRKYSFIKPTFICGLALKDFIKFDQPHHYTLFRALMESKKINIIVATSVIEEGIDIPICNVVIRYDYPVTYRAYAQSRGRARDKNSVYFLFTPDNMREEIRRNFTEYYLVDRETEKLKDQIHKSFITDEDYFNDSDIEKMSFYRNGLSTLYPTYSLQLLNQYISKLTRDSITDYHLPMYQFEKHEIDKNIANVKKKYAYVFIFPAYSSFSGHLIPGAFFESQRIAKIHCAFRTCIYLIQNDEIDKHLKIVNEKFLIENHRFDLNIRQSGQELRIKNYEKKISNFFTNLSSPNTEINQTNCDNYYYLYALEFDLLNNQNNNSNNDHIRLKQNEQFFKPKFLSSTNQSIGLIIKATTKPFEELCSYFYFNLFPIKFCLIPCGKYCDKNKFEIIKHFNEKHVFDLILNRFRSLNCNVDQCELNTSIMTVLVKRKTFSKQYIIDFDQMQKCYEWMNQMNELRANKDSSSHDYQKTINAYNPSNIDEDFQLFGYLCSENIDLYFRHTDFTTNINDRMVDKNSGNHNNDNANIKTYKEHFEHQHKRKLKYDDQLMIHGKLLKTFYHNFSLKKINSTTIGKKHMYHNFYPRELLLIYPLNSNTCLRIMSLPLILYRLEQYQLCKEFLQTLNEFGIDSEHCNYYDFEYDYNNISSSSQTHDLHEYSVINPEHIEIPNKMQSKNTKNVIDETLLKLIANEDNVNDEHDQSNLIDIDSSIDKIYEELIMKLQNFIKNNKNDKSKQINDECSFIDEKFIHENEKFDYSEVSLLKFEGNIDTLIDNDGVYFDHFDIQCPNPWHILNGLTLAKANDLWNIERYETVGDAFIKMASSLYLFFNYPRYDEYRMTILKTALINNRNLALIALEKQINQLIFESNGTIIYEEFFKRLIFMKNNKNDDDDGYNNYIAKLREKDMADCIEALIGVFLIHGSTSAALAFLKYLDLKAYSHNDMKNNLIQNIKQQNKIKIIENVFHYNDTTFEEIPIEHIHEKFKFNVDDNLDDKLIEKVYNKSLLNEVEKIIDYQFTNKLLLVMAFTHNSNCRLNEFDSTKMPSYQKLEFIGDSIIDHLLTNYLFLRNEKLNPQEMTEIRSALVNNMFYAHIMIKFQLHKYILHSSIALGDSIGKFVKKFRFNTIEKLFEIISEEYEEILNDDDDDNCNNIDEMDVPKVLPDVFEALIAAIWIDCQFKFDFVWKILYRMFFREINHFLKHRPKMPLNRLYLEYPKHVFSEIEIDNDSKSSFRNQTIMKVNLTVEPFGTFKGRGSNSRQCRISATKKFFKHLRKL